MNFVRWPGRSSIKFRSKRAVDHKISGCESTKNFYGIFGNNAKEICSMTTVFVLDDDTCLAETLCEALSEKGRVVRAFSDPILALAALSETEVDVFISDLSMPWVDGKDVLVSARARHPDLQILLMSAYPRGAE